MRSTLAPNASNSHEREAVDASDITNYPLYVDAHGTYSIFDCPSLIFSSLFFYLTLIEVITLSRVSKFFHKEVTKHLWALQTLCLPEGVVPGHVLDRFLDKCRNLRSVDASNCQFMTVNNIIEAVAKYAPNLCMLHTPYDRWDHNISLDSRNRSAFLLEHAPHLLECMNVCVADVELFQKQLPRCRNLHELTFWRTPLLPNILTPCLSLPSAISLKFFFVDFESNAIQQILSRATSLTMLKIQDCGYDDAHELAPLYDKKLTKLEFIHSPIDDNIVRIDTSGLVKFGIDWCPVIADTLRNDTLTTMLSRATKLQSLTISAGSLTHALVDVFSAAKPFSKSIKNLHIKAVATCAAHFASVDDADSQALFSLFPTSLQKLHLSNFPLVHALPLSYFPTLTNLELDQVHVEADILALHISQLQHLERLRLSNIPSQTQIFVINPNLKHVSLESCALPTVTFNNCPKLETVKFVHMANLTWFNIIGSHLSKLVVRRCFPLHHFLVSAQFLGVIAHLTILKCIKIVDCDLCYEDVKQILNNLKETLICALVDFDGADTSLINKIAYQITSACSKLCRTINPAFPKLLNDVKLDSKLSLITNFPFYRWVEVLSDTVLASQAQQYMSHWMFLLFKIRSYVGY